MSHGWFVFHKLQKKKTEEKSAMASHCCKPVTAILLTESSGTNDNVKKSLIHRSTQQQTAFTHDPIIATSPMVSIPFECLIACLSQICRTSIGPAAAVCKQWRNIIHSNEFLKARAPKLEPFLAVVSASTAFDDKEHPVRVQLYQPALKAWKSCLFSASGVNIDDFSASCPSNHGLYLFSGVIGNCRMSPPVFYDFWTNQATYVAKMGTARMKFVCGEIEGKVYVAGGVKNRHQLTEPASKQPFKLEAKISGKEVDMEEKFDKEMETMEEKIDLKCLGGGGGKSSVPEWKNIFRQVLPRRRVLSALQVSEARDLSSCERYDPETGRWEDFPDMHLPRVGGIGGAIDGKLYVIGGTCKNKDDSVRSSRSFEVFDPSTNTWTLHEQMPDVGFVLGSVVLGRTIFIVRRNLASLSWVRFDTADLSWTDMHEVPIPPDHQQTHLVKFDCVAVGDKIYVVQVWGSRADLERRLTDVLPLSVSGGALVMEYDPEKEGDLAWRELPDLPKPTRGAVCVGVVC